MSELSVKDGLTAMEVASYLRRHSDFLKEFPDIAMILRLPREQGSAASLASYQLEVLRDKNNEFSRRLHDLIEIAHENRPGGPRAYPDAGPDARPASPTRRGSSPTETSTPLVRVVLFRSRSLVEADGRGSMPAFADFLKRGEPLCGRLQQDKLDALFGARAGDVQSAVLLAIGEVGMLAIGSLDANRFHPGMGTVFLRLIAEAMSAAVGRYSGS
jgi:hypothetical protein